MKKNISCPCGAVVCCEDHVLDHLLGHMTWAELQASGWGIHE